MADTGIDAVIKQTNAEYCKRYRLKRRFQMQQQTSTSSEPQLDEKQKKAEYDKQYKLKRKMLIQQQTSTSSETDLVQKQQKAEYAKQYRLERKLKMQEQASASSETESAPSKLGTTVLMKKTTIYLTLLSFNLRHIHDPVLLSLKMEGIRLFFKLNKTRHNAEA
jgi:hypothetical protein